MPQNFVFKLAEKNGVSKADAEVLWKKAKAAAGETYNKETQPKIFWATTTMIFKRMVKVAVKESRMVSRILAEATNSGDVKADTIGRNPDEAGRRDPFDVAYINIARFSGANVLKQYRCTRSVCGSQFETYGVVLRCLKCGSPGVVRES